MRIVRYLSVVSLSSFAVAQAFVLQVLDIGTQTPIHISEVHFFAAGNDFGWSIMWLSPIVLDIPQDIDADGQFITCQQQLRWLYYNNQRGQRLYPLDLQTAQYLETFDNTYENLAMTWWLYSQCTWTGIDIQTIVWQIVYDHNGTQTELFAWLEYIYNTNIRQYPLRNSLQYFSGNPLWYIYDSAGGIGFVGWLFDQHEVVLWFIEDDESIQTIFTQSGDTVYGYWSPVITVNDTQWTTGWQIAIQGILAATKSIDAIQTDALIQEYNSMAISTTAFTTADIFNQQRKRMYQQCQWRTQATSIEDDDTVLCINYPNYSPTQQFTINLASSSYADKTIFIKNADIHLYGTMEYTSAPLNVFIDNGNIVWHTDSVELIDFDNIGNPIAEPGVSQWLFLRGNFFIDGLFVPAGWSFSHKTYVHGKLISLHAPDTATIAKQNHIITKFWSGLEDYISLQEVFAWRCNIATNTATDGTSCSSLVDTYALAPLVVIDRYFPSILLQ